MLVNGTEINNRAAIYFDYNKPIITNTVALIVTAPTSIEAKPDESVTAYPNPAGEHIFFRLRSATDKIIRIELFDLSGRKCAETALEYLTISRLPEGMYFFRVLTGKGDVLTGKVMKAAEY